VDIALTENGPVWRAPAQVLSPARLAAVRRSGLLDTPREEAFDRFARLAATTLGEVTAFVTIVDERRSFWKACISPTGSTLPVRQNTVQESFCQYVIGRDEPLIVVDARIHPVTRGNPSVDAMGVLAWAGFPVRSPDGQVLGTFCVVGDRPRDWTPSDLQTLETLAHAVAGEVALRIAVDDARAASREAEDAARRAQGAASRAAALAAVLQESLLPRDLHHPPELDVAAAFRSAGDGADVLGDFYDAFSLHDGRWGFVVGDVCGKGPQAARTTALTRATVRAIGHDGRDPAEVLTVLDQVLDDWNTDPTHPVAACYATSRPYGPDLHLEVAAAGHPLPLLRRLDGTVAECGEPGTMLGCRLPLTVTSTDVVLPPGALLVLHTDGVTEARSPSGGELFDDHRLHTLLTALPVDATARSVAAAIIDAVEQFTAGPLHDDLAVLVLRNPVPPIGPR
jgi:serine phosphatase RsbU (regulator of sigma subunit)